MVKSEYDDGASSLNDFEATPYYQLCQHIHGAHPGTNVGIKQKPAEELSENSHTKQAKERIKAINNIERKYKCRYACFNQRAQVLLIIRMLC
jgi:hypothetical protein